ncbi:hypothetical protein LINGRAHAP2_LOCUS3008 [Linum grandiflorum]
MGNCSPRGITTAAATADEEVVCSSSIPIRVRTDSGEILEFKSPKLARDLINDFPGFTIHREIQTEGSSPSTPVPQSEYLVAGQFYCLLPVPAKVETASPQTDAVSSSGEEESKKEKDSSAALHVLPSHREGVWKVKLVIDTKRLGEIWSEQENVEALIEKMRMAAAVSESLTPRRSRSSWGLTRKPAAALSHLLTLPN